MGVFWAGVVAMAITYAAVFLVGVLASRGRPSHTDGEAGLVEMMLAGRSMPLWVALLTMTATWVGGGYINGTAESTYLYGAIWGIQPGIGYGLSLILGGLLFARTMRRHGYTTLIDPLEARYGRWTAALLTIPAVLAEVIWSGAILVALGTTFGTILGMNTTAAIVLSASVAILYTLAGGLRSVAYTDVIQLFLIAIGLGIAVPIVISVVGGWGVLFTAGTPMAGAAPQAVPPINGPGEVLNYLDWFFLLLLGGIPWNVYFQRVLASRDEQTAARLSMISGVLCMAFALLPLCIGLAARHVDWVAVAGPEVAATLQADGGATNVLPFVLRYAIPTWAAVIGLGAVSAAVMSSVDSSILSASSLVAWNGWRRLIRPSASVREITWLIRGLIASLGALATVLALTVGSVKDLWYLCGDVVYCVLFPQLLLALFDKKANWIGALCALAVAGFLRMGGGVSVLGIPGFLPYPVLTEGYEFPFRTLAMVCGLITAVIVSRLTSSLAPPTALGPVETLGIQTEDAAEA